MSKIRSRSWATAAAVAMAMFALANSASAQEGHTQKPGQKQSLESSDVVARDSQGNIVRRENRTGFGEHRQWTFSTDAALSFERRTQSNTASVTTLSFLPATDYFVLKNFSVGGVIGVVYQKAGDTKSTAFKVGPRVGYNIKFSHLLSFWPKIGISYSHTKYKTDIVVGGEEFRETTKNNAVQLNISAPVLVHPAEHLFVGFGPFVDTDLNGDHRVTIWGLRLSVGGWI